MTDEKCYMENGKWMDARTRKFTSLKLVIGTLMLVCACSVIVRSQSAQPQDDDTSFTKIGQQMPSFAITDLSGTEIKIGDLKGKVVLVVFWATWCGPCITEMPRLEKQIWRKFKSYEFVMIAIAREETEKEITAFRKDYGYSFPMAADPDREVYKLFGSEGIPRSYVVGVDGKILFQFVGFVRSEFVKMKNVIEKELKRLQKPKSS